MEDETQVAIDLAVEEDAELLREALEALEAIWELCDYLPQDANVGSPTFGLLNEIQVKARATITKLEERLLRE